MKLIRRIALGLSVWAGVHAQAATPVSPWEQPAAAMAEQISSILGPGQTQITFRNLSTIPSDQIPSIRRLIEQDLKVRGVVTSDTGSANGVRITLSENSQQALWVAEILEGNQTQVAMVTLNLASPVAPMPAGHMTLRRQQMLTSREKILSAMEMQGVLVALEPEQLVLYAQGPDGWHEKERTRIGQRRPLSRDPRGVLVPGSGALEFRAELAATECLGVLNSSTSSPGWSVNCHEADDPWPIANPAGTNSSMGINAFYNAARNYFTGVVTPSVGVDLPPFYSAALIPRAAGGGALVLNGIDGKVQIVDNSALRPVTGTRDWGSDSAVLHSECGSGAQIVASGSGEAANDSLRAYELPALEAVPASAPLAVDGSISALWGAPDGKSVFVVVRSRTNQYEVDRVTALCN